MLGHVAFLGTTNLNPRFTAFPFLPQAFIGAAMTSIPVPPNAAASQPLPADWRDLLALTKPRVMSLVVFTGLCGLLAAPGRDQSGARLHRGAVHRAWRGRGGRAQPMV